MLSLPPELWDRIRNYLTKRDTLQLLLVCKAWNTTIIRLIGESIHITSNGSPEQLNQLLQDLVRYATFADKVDKLKIESYFSYHIDSHPILRRIIALCSNLIELKFTGTKVYEYLKMLNSGKKLLPNIQRINVTDLTYCSPSVRRLYVWVNYRYKTAITSLRFVDISVNKALYDYGGLIKYISLFSHLTEISIRGAGTDETTAFDFNELLQTNSNLEYVHIRDINCLKCVIFKMPSPTDTYPSLKKLRLNDLNVDIAFLPYVVSRLSGLQEFTFNKVTVVANNFFSEITSTNEDTFIELFNTLTADRVDLSYSYNGREYDYYVNKPRNVYPGTESSEREDFEYSLCEGCMAHRCFCTFY